LLETRHDIFVNDALGDRIGQNAFDAVAGFDFQLAVILGDYQQHAVIHALATEFPGIGNADALAAKAHMEESIFSAAENFARRKRLGPFAQGAAPPEKRQKQLNAFLRAGHGFDLAKRFVYAEPGDEISED